MIYKAEQLPPEEEAEPRASASISFDGETHELTGRTAVLGRSKDCEIRLADPNVSRRHAEIRPDGDGYKVVDLDSTNGIEVNGKRLKELALVDGAQFTLGTTEISFSQAPD
jgi:pSer/pThr/pTyr-binding forkhead associated (FHA) protein